MTFCHWRIHSLCCCSQAWSCSSTFDSTRGLRWEPLRWWTARPPWSRAPTQWSMAVERTCRIYWQNRNSLFPSSASETSSGYRSLQNSSRTWVLTNWLQKNLVPVSEVEMMTSTESLCNRLHIHLQGSSNPEYKHWKYEKIHVNYDALKEVNEHDKPKWFKSSKECLWNMKTKLLTWDKTVSPCTKVWQKSHLNETFPIDSSDSGCREDILTILVFFKGLQNVNCFIMFLKQYHSPVNTLCLHILIFWICHIRTQ